jgi:hypothetical protein
VLSYLRGKAEHPPLRRPAGTAESARSVAMAKVERAELPGRSILRLLGKDLMAG